MPIVKSAKGSEIRPLVHHVDPDSPPPILRFEIQSVGTQGLLWSAKRLRPTAGGVFVVTGEPFNLHRTAGSVTLNIDDRGWMIWKQDTRQWEVLTSAAGTGVSVVRFALNYATERNSTTPVSATIVEWNGSAYVPKTDAAIWVVDSVGEWGKAGVGFLGWGVQIADRPTYYTSGSERAVYEILFLESYARWGEATLNEDMGETEDNEAEAQISTSHEQWGAAPNHRPHSTDPGIITIKDRYRAGGCLKSGDQVLWLWNEQTDTYYLLAPQAGGKVSVREKDPCDYLEDQMHNLTPNSPAAPFTDIDNYSEETNEAEDGDPSGDWKVRDFIAWGKMSNYSTGSAQVLMHTGTGDVEWRNITPVPIVEDVRLEGLNFEKYQGTAYIIRLDNKGEDGNPEWDEFAEGTECD